MTEVEWTGDQIIRLVNEYKSKPELWDPHHSCFRVQTTKYEAYSALAESFDCDIVDLKKKLNSIFASHRREKGKIRSGGRSNWFLYPYLSFLPNHIENNEHRTPRRQDLKKRPISDEEEEEEVEELESEHSYDENGVAEEIIIKEEPMSVVEEPPKVQQKFSNPKPRLTRLLRRKLVKGLRQEPPSSSSIVLDTMKLIKKSDMMRKKDECDSFGEYIAVSLRKHDERTQAMIKQAINNILFEQEMKKYNTTQYTVVVTGMEDNPLMDHEGDK